MSRTIRKFKGNTYPDKKRKERKDVKHFGYTSGTHSRFDDLPEERKDGQTYAIKNKDYVKYGYGKGIRKENKVKNHKKEIE